jgi:hypothetical protein
MSRAVVGSRVPGTSRDNWRLAVVRVPPPPSGVGATAMHHRASPQGAELTAHDITFSGLRRRGDALARGRRARDELSGAMAVIWLRDLSRAG